MMTAHQAFQGDTGCPTRDELFAFAVGRLAADARERIARHIDGCTACCNRLNQFTEENDRLVADLRRPVPAHLFTDDKGTDTSLRGAELRAESRSLSERSTTEAAGRPAVPGYDILQELGRGGMGVVYQARQVSLNRLVALKMILAGSHAGTEHKARFRVEAEAVARLQHPNIVQVHEVGEHDGQAYLALEFVEGGSLAQRQAGTPLPPAGAARLVETLARAVHHAHQRNIIHRDLKPANVLLTADGIPKIADFGLAKQLEGEGVTASSGVIMGTPSYMSPEQARGVTRQVGPAVDVYALGAILYELLTGRPPFKAATALETLEQVLHQEPVPPRRLQPGLPRDLETSCLKCLHKEAGRRYADAATLGEDLRRFQAGEPIVARPVGIMERSWKWARRRPAVAAAVAITVLAVLSLLAGALWHNRQLSAAYHDLAQQQQQTQQESDRAEANFKKTLEAVDRLLTRVGDQRLVHVPWMEQIRREVLEDALQFFQEFLREKSTDPTVRRETARAHLRVAKIHHLMGQEQAAEANYRAALDLFSELADAYPARPDYRQDLAGGMHNRGVLLHALNRLNEAQVAFQRAVEILAGLAAEFPSEVEYRFRQGQSHNNLAMLLQDIGDFAGAAAAFNDGLGIYQQLAAEHADRPQYKQELARSFEGLALVRAALLQMEPAKEAHQHALDLRQQLVDAFPRRPDYRQELANSYHNLACFLRDTGETGKAKDAFGKARQVQQQLAGEFPARPEYRQELARTFNNLGILLGSRHQLAEAREAFQEARKIHSQLAADFPTWPEYRQELARTYTNLANICMLTNQMAEAQEAIGEAQILQEKLAADFPKRPEYRQELGGSINTLSIVLNQTSRFQEAMEAGRRALGIRRRLVADLPNVPGYRAELATTLTNLGAFLRDTEEQFTQSQQYLEEALSEQQAALKANPKNPVYRRRVGTIYENLALTLMKTSDHAGAVNAVNEMLRFATGQPEDFYSGCCIFARCVPLAANDFKLAEGARKELVQAYGARATALLGEAIAKGFSDAAHVRQDKDLDPIRMRADFQQLMQRLETKAKP